MEVNVCGLVQQTRLMLPGLRRTRGRVVMISSVAGSVATPVLGPYCCWKFALEAFADSLRRELRGSGVSITTVQPGSVATPMWDKFRESVAAGVHPAYSDKFSRFLQWIATAKTRGMPPSLVASVVKRALIARHPPERIVMARGGRLGLRLQTLLSDSLQDRFVDDALR